MALAGLAVGGVVYVLVMPYMSGERKASKRVANVAQSQSKAQRRAALPQPLQMRKQQVQDTHQEHRGQAEEGQAGAAPHRA